MLVLGLVFGAVFAPGDPQLDEAASEVAPTSTRDPVRELELEWSSSASACPGAEELRAFVGAQLSKGGARTPAVARGQLRPAPGGGYALELELRDEWSHDRFRAHSVDCDELGWLAAGLLANALDPFAWTMPPEDEALELPAQSAPAAAVPVHASPLATTHVERSEAWPSTPQSPERPAPEQLTEQLTGPSLPQAFPDESAPRAPRFEAPGPAGLQRDRDVQPPNRRAPESALLELHGGGLINPAPNPVPSLRAGAALELGRGRARGRVLLGAGGWLGGSESVPEFAGEGPAPSLALRGWSIDVGGCGVLSAGPVDFPLCARLGAGEVLAETENTDVFGAGRQPWFWLGSDAKLEWWMVARVALTLELGVGANLTRPAFEVANSGLRYSADTFQIRAGVGLTVRLWGRRQDPKKNLPPSQTAPALADNQTKP